MRSRILRIGYLLLWLALAPVGVWAHTSVTSIKPPSGSVLQRSPETIELTFGEPARLTSVVVVAADKTERTLAFTPTATAAVSFQIKAPQLAPGRNEIRWKALSKDGHVISGTVVITIEPAS